MDEVESGKERRGGERGAGESESSRDAVGFDILRDRTGAIPSDGLSSRGADGCCGINEHRQSDIPHSAMVATVNQAQGLIVMHLVWFGPRSRVQGLRLIFRAFNQWQDSII